MTNDITILSCPQCGFPKIRDCGNGLYQCDDCGTHFDKDENIVLTEQEWLQTASTEQLAEYILNVWLDGALNVNAEFGLNEAQIEQHKGYIVEWLKQPHSEVEE